METAKLIELLDELLAHNEKELAYWVDSNLPQREYYQGKVDAYKIIREFASN